MVGRVAQAWQGCILRGTGSDGKVFCSQVISGFQQAWCSQRLCQAWASGREGGREMPAPRLRTSVLVPWCPKAER